MDHQPYVFISYAHKDIKAVLPCINALRRSGIHVWYDEGIEAGSEWPEFIAQKVINCSKFILFLTDSYLASQNCKRELNFAISRKKDILSIFLQDVSLSPGMEMQLGSYQAFFRNRFSNDIVFYDMLCREPYFDSCRTYGASAPVYRPPVYQPAPATPVFPSAPPAARFPSVKSGIPKRSRIIAFLLSFCFGVYGIQKFYLGQNKLAIRYLIFFFTGIPFCLSLVEGFMILFSSKEKLYQKYGFDFTW